MYITEDEGESYTVVATPFTPNTLLFQSILAPNSTDSPYNKYVLGYDSAAQTVSVGLNHLTELGATSHIHLCILMHFFFVSEPTLLVLCIDVQLWVSVDLGRNWNKIGNNVSAGRYYWRRLGSDTEGDLSTVYHEQRTSANSTYKLYLSICILLVDF